MEREHGLAGSNRDGNPRVFFRKHIGTEELRSLALIGEFDSALDDSRKYPDPVQGLALDSSSGCTESCDAFSAEGLLSDIDYDTDHEYDD